MRERLFTVLRDRFSFSQFLPQQLEVLQCLEAGQSVLAIWPTGGGKTLCYQHPAFWLPGLIVVVSPLIALMEDQKRRNQALGIECEAIHSGMSADGKSAVLRLIQEKKLKILLVTPERLAQKEFFALLSNSQISLLVIDEAHCISQWGHDFRPDYSRLGDLREQLGRPLTLALTATATEQVQKDISLQLREANFFVSQGDLRRPNLRLQVCQVHGLNEKIRNLVGLRAHFPGSCIVYFSLIQNLYKFSYELARLGMSHWIYHGDMEPQQRRKAQKLFFESNEGLMLATPAFGLGIDKQDIRLICHAEIPGSLESYFQEVGRAGRDQRESLAFLNYDPEDVSIQMEFLKWAMPEPEFLKTVFYLIERNVSRLDTEGLDFLKKQMNFYNSRDFRVETAINQLERLGVLSKRDIKKFRNFPFEIARPLESTDLSQEQHLARWKIQNQKLLEMVQYATAESGCRMQLIIKYFGQSGSLPCGKCDLCENS
jgi:ATP-dependent DNA helicase RecQ